ncbi:MAG: hypothetical protein ABJF11_18525 [Reichenbachiella sp.]|uniref:hypothetical protein n=1 Tax=Reichenbachiella sp. TaxID=2184521 RepID=UPI00326719C9
MKINGKNKSQSHDQLDSNESSTDQVSKQAVRVVEEVPVKNFDPLKTWEKLSQRLGQVDKRFVTWGLAMAASFSLLVAANLSLPEWNFIKDEIAPSAQIGTGEKIAELSRTQLSPVLISKFNAVPVSMPISKNQRIQITPKLSPIEKTVLVRDKKEIQEVEISPLSNPFVSGFAKVNFQAEGLTPEMGIDFKVAENYTAKRREIYKLGVSTQINFTNSETSERKIHPHTFFNFEFTSLNKKTNKGWTSRAGYLINPDGQLFQDTTIKVSLFRNLGKHLKIGPEIIFTDNFKRSYPSISLVLG